MKPLQDEASWKQHFPTYQFEDRDIALKEYESATKALEAEERVFLNAVNVSVGIGAALGTLALGSLDKLTMSFIPVVPEVVTLGILILLAGGFAGIVLRYFAERQKAVVFATRKVIVLRRMLGMSYGNLQLVLPNWRIEGADEPFAVRLFPGWKTYVAYPCFAVSGISSVVAFFILSALLKNLIATGVALPFALLPFLFVIATLWFIFLCFIYRSALKDTHETTDLILSRFISKAIGLTLVDNIEYVIYRATLATYEMHRLNIDLSNPEKLLVHIEDKEFYRHPGVSLRGLGRIAKYLVGVGPRSGGSTITQQLVRTLFIVDQKKLVRRKFIEIALALWFNRIVTKRVQIQMYLASVRYDTGIFGLPDAMRHFLGSMRRNLSVAESFFLVERVSNVRSRLLVEKIDQMLRGAVAARVLSLDDVKHVILFYAAAIRNGKIDDPKGVDVRRLQVAWNHLITDQENTGVTYEKTVNP